MNISTKPLISSNMIINNLSIIVAIARNGVIGSDNRLLWHISEDLRRFKAITSGHTVIMGRKTYESIGRPLPNRRNIIITRDVNREYAGCEIASSLNNALAMTHSEEEVFIIGGGQVYAEALPFAARLYLTLVDADYEGDTRFPNIQQDAWIETLHETHARGEKFDKPFEFINLVRRLP